MKNPVRHTNAEPPSGYLWRRIGRGALALMMATALGLPAAGAGSPGAVAQAASAGVAAAEIAPADSVLYLGLTLDLESPQWVLANELLLRAGVEQDVNDLFSELTESTTGQEVDRLAEAAALLGGEAAIVVTTLDTVAEQAGGLTDITGGLDVPAMNDDAATAGGFVLVIEPSDLAAATLQLDEELASDARDLGLPVEETTYNGITIRSVAGDKIADEAGIAYAVVGRFIVVGETAADIEPLIDTAAGTLDSLSAVPAFERADAALAGERLAFGFIDGTVAAAEVAGLAEEDPDLAALGPLTGLDTLAVSVGFTVAADDAGFRFHTVEIPADGATMEAAGTALELGFAERVPGDSLIFVNGFDLGQGALLQSLGLFLVSAVGGAFMTPDAAMPPDAVATPVADPAQLYEDAAALIGFNLKTDFIDQLVGEYGFALWGVDLADPAGISAILTSGIATPAVLADSLSKLSLLVQAAGQGQATVTTKTVGESLISSAAIGVDPATTITVDYGVVEDEFLLGVGAGIDSYLGAQTASLADDAEYQAALAELPAEYDGIFFVDVAEAIELAMAAESGLGMGLGGDASEACGEFASQEEAQAAYEEDTISNFDLDLDFDGEACEDYFKQTLAATPVAAGVTEFSAVRSFATVSYKEDGLAFTSSILVIAEE